MVVPVTSSRPNSTPMNSSGVAIQAVSPSESGPPMAKPMKPAACWRPAGSCGEPDHRCHSPSAGSAIIAAPRISRGRASGSGSVRIRTTAIAASEERQQHDGRADDHAQDGVDPAADRPGGVEPGTGGDDDGDAQQRQRDAVAPVAGLDVAGAARPSGRSIRRPWRPSASRRGRPGRRRSPAAAMRDGAAPFGRLPARARAAPARVPDREPAFDLLERAPERAAVLLAMGASLVATAPYSPSATLVTD